VAPDVLHAHSPALCGMAGLRVARKLGIPLVYEIRAFGKMPPSAMAPGDRATSSIC
jgi:hypothetical protein